MDDLFSSQEGREIIMLRCKDKVTALIGDPEAWMCVYNAMTMAGAVADTLDKYSKFGRKFMEETDPGDRVFQRTDEEVAASKASEIVRWFVDYIMSLEVKE